jgi:hypothetical protein
MVIRESGTMSRKRTPLRHPRDTTGALTVSDGTLTVSDGTLAASLARFGPSMTGPLEFRDAGAAAQAADPPLAAMTDPTLMGLIAPASWLRRDEQKETVAGGGPAPVSPSRDTDNHLLLSSRLRPAPLRTGVPRRPE